jgi:hypothetical protein
MKGRQEAWNHGSLQQVDEMLPIEEGSTGGMDLSSRSMKCSPLKKPCNVWGGFLRQSAMRPHQALETHLNRRGAWRGGARVSPWGDLRGSQGRLPRSPRSSPRRRWERKEAPHAAKSEEVRGWAPEIIKVTASWEWRERTGRRGWSRSAAAAAGGWVPCSIRSELRACRGENWTLQMAAGTAHRSGDEKSSGSRGTRGIHLVRRCRGSGS